MESGMATPKLKDLLPWVSLRTCDSRVATLFHASVMSSIVRGTVTSVRMKPRRVALIPRMNASMALWVCSTSVRLPSRIAPAPMAEVSTIGRPRAMARFSQVAE
jgi:hypothetical protein